MQKLLSSNYNALIFLKSQACTCIPELFPLKRKTCIHLHILDDILMFILFISLKF